MNPHLTSCRRQLVLTLLFFLICMDLRAQLPGEAVPEDSVYKVLLPVAAYDSDLGLIGGAIYNRIDYRGDTRPFDYYLIINPTLSTKGMFSLQMEYDKTNLFGGGIRGKAEVLVYRFIQDYYFGVGNNTGFDIDLFDNKFYFFESLGFQARYEIRIPLYLGIESGSRLDLLVGLGSRYETSDVRKDSSMFNINRPRGFDGGWVNDVKAGLVWENRNNEFSPTSGNRLEMTVRAAPEFLFSKFGLVEFRADYRQYIRVFNWMTLAARLQLSHMEGDVPYWEMSRLGDEETLRGYPLNRFLGNSSVGGTLELRKWLIEFPGQAVRLGGHVFTDVGRVFTGADNADDLFSNYKQTFGLGGVVSLFSPDVIFRGEVGFSKELMRVYIGIGYTF